MTSKKRDFEKELDGLISRVTALEGTVTDNCTTIEKLRRASQKHTDRLAMLSKAELDEIDAHAQDLSGRMQAMLGRITVGTEVFRALKGVVPVAERAAMQARLVKAFDESDEWWKSHAEKTIGAWIDFLTHGRWGRVSVEDEREDEAA